MYVLNVDYIRKKASYFKFLVKHVSLLKWFPYFKMPVTHRLLIKENSSVGNYLLLICCNKGIITKLI